MVPDRIVTDDPPALAGHAAAWIVLAIGDVIARRGGCALALAGGSTPRPVYQRLATIPGVPWRAMSIFFADERAVAPQHPASNYGMASEALLSRVPLSPRQIHRMEGERPDLDRAAREYEALLPESLDLLLLGMGRDGHVASLFPGAASLEERSRRVIHVAGGDPVPDRLTITPAVIEVAGEILMMVAGADKAESVARALEGTETAAAVPARLARRGTWILDRAAASRLSGAR